MKYKFLGAISVAILPMCAFADLIVDEIADPGNICWSEESSWMDYQYPARVVLCGPAEMYGDDLSWFGPRCGDINYDEFRDTGRGCLLGENNGYIVHCDLPSYGENICAFCDSGPVDTLPVWVESGANRVSRSIWESVGEHVSDSDNWSCDFDVSETVEYGCSAGYYQSSGTGASMTCSRCPSSGGIYGTNSIGTTSITSCYIPSGTSFSDDSGSGTYTGNCYYSN